MPNDIENVNKDVVRENNQNNSYKNTNPNINNAKEKPYEQNHNIDLVSRSNIHQHNAVSNYPNNEDKNNENTNNVNANNQNNELNAEDITDVNINTLDETVAETLVKIFFIAFKYLIILVYKFVNVKTLIQKREFKRICFKLECVLLPRFNANKSREIHNWDLWGPLLFCLILSAYR